MAGAMQRALSATLGGSADDAAALLQILADAATDGGDAQLGEEVRAPPSNTRSARSLARTAHPPRSSSAPALHPSLHRYESFLSSIQSTAASGAARGGGGGGGGAADGGGGDAGGLPPDAAAAAAAAFARRVRLPGVPTLESHGSGGAELLDAMYQVRATRHRPPARLPRDVCAFFGRRPWPRP